MVKFIGEYYWLVFGLVKIAIMLGFFINAGGLLTIIERRQMAVIQDRIGPNRAVVTVPGVALKGLLGVPPLLAAGLIGAIAYAVWPPTMVEVGGAGVLTGVARGFWMLQVGVLMAWSHLMLLGGYIRGEAGRAQNPLESWLADLEDPRWIFYTGLAAHVTLFLVYGSAGTPAVGQALAYAGPAVLALTLVSIGAYAGYRIPAGPVGLRFAGFLHPAADGLKFVFKEDFVPPNADKLLHGLAPIISLFPALVVFAVIPFGDTLCFGKTDGLLDVTKLALEVPRDGMCDGIEIPLQVADLNIGILYVFAMAGTGIVGAAIAGWSSDNKWSLLGGLRAASQMVSYEVVMGLSLVGAFMIYGSPRLGDMVRWQSENTWGIFVQPAAFFLFFAAALAEQKRAPFDSPEGESEIVAGYLVEYSSFKFAMFYTAEFIEAVIASALLVSIFLGGWSLPFLHPDGITVSFGDAVIYRSPMTHVGVTILQVLTFYGKVIALALMHVFIRWTVLRFRYDQIMSFGWKFLLPSAIGNLVVTGLALLAVDQGGTAVASALKLMSDACNVLVALLLVGMLVRLVVLFLSPVDRHRFVRSTAAARAARQGGVKSEPMQALGARNGELMGGGIVGKPIPRPQRNAVVSAYFPAIVSGLGVTIKRFFKNTKEMMLDQRNDPVLEAFDAGITTISYPEQKRPYPERFRGLHRLTLREDGAPRCVACLCCSTACPAQCIHITTGEYPEGDKRRGYERYPVEFVIDELRCIFCGYCVEACPCDAIRMDTGQHAVPYDSREQFIYKRDLLMSFSDANGKQLSENPRHEPAEGFPITRQQHH